MRMASSSSKSSPDADTLCTECGRHFKGQRGLAVHRRVHSPTSKTSTKKQTNTQKLVSPDVTNSNKNQPSLSSWSPASLPHIVIFILILAFIHIVIFFWNQIFNEWKNETDNKSQFLFSILKSFFIQKPNRNVQFKKFFV